jgi:hypothetical protein
MQSLLVLPTACPRGSLVPSFFDLSFLLNVYFGLWLSHLSTKYRYLLGSVPGVSAIDLGRLMLCVGRQGLSVHDQIKLTISDADRCSGAAIEG